MSPKRVHLTTEEVSSVPSQRMLLLVVVFANYFWVTVVLTPGLY